MARGKKRKSSVRQAKPVAAEQPVESKKSKAVSAPRRRFSVLDYIFICIFFVVFCYIQKFVAIWLLQAGVVPTLEAIEQEALDFFFDTMWKGFLVVAALVALHDFFYKSEVEEEESPST